MGYRRIIYFHVVLAAGKLVQFTETHRSCRMGRWLLQKRVAVDVKAWKSLRISYQLAITFAVAILVQVTHLS
ncbi:hypothetical protein CPB83DRAFT_855498 [Crepidotus variabilis]|uniref:Uncharacterized protein n=1 Tax=Crepidotus variabilis TaxID=179855 RepID=A0A9P6EFH6_9AGAR|nr:hypothetical protein CPB83DRAFT_855498 [Crepidotus variabilis]